MCDPIKNNGRNKRRCYTYINSRERATNLVHMDTRLDIVQIQDKKLL